MLRLRRLLKTGPRLRGQVCRAADVPRSLSPLAKDPRIELKTDMLPLAFTLVGPGCRGAAPDLLVEGPLLPPFAQARTSPENSVQGAGDTVQDR